jgi:hypothetical protein
MFRVNKTKLKILFNHQKTVNLFQGKTILASCIYSLYVVGVYRYATTVKKVRCVVRRIRYALYYNYGTTISED